LTHVLGDDAFSAHIANIDFTIQRIILKSLKIMNALRKYFKVMAVEDLTQSTLLLYLGN
tara:strand:- start:608 stop:784 length:177 start_codon:yes stop_codon:yes gene_type:complete